EVGRRAEPGQPDPRGGRQEKLTCPACTSRSVESARLDAPAQFGLVADVEPAAVEVEVPQAVRRLLPWSGDAFPGVRRRRWWPTASGQPGRQDAPAQRQYFVVGS